jgi:hypothetical protein
MKGAALGYGALLLMACALTPPLRAVEVTDQDRTYGNFMREAATVGDGKIRLELRGMTMDNENSPRITLAGVPVDDFEQVRNICKNHTDRGCSDPTNDFELDHVQGGTIDLLGSYGLGKNGEAGFDMPLYIQKSRFFDATNGTANKPTVTHTINSTDVGDLMLYAKFKRTVADHCTVGAGLELRLPTGVERDGFGYGEMGFNPFISARYQYDRFAVGAHVGYQIFTGPPADQFNFSIEAIVRGNSSYSFRTEVLARYFKDFGDKFSDLSIMPGFDFNLAPNFTIRPQALANLTSDAIDWGLGVGIVLTL